MSKKYQVIRVYKDDYFKMRDLKLDVSNTQRVNVSTPEILRRILNINEVKTRLNVDAEYKRRFKK